MLTPCGFKIDKVTKLQTNKVDVTEECKDSWKYRPGENATGRTGPGIYSMRGVDGFCLNDPKNKKNKTAEQKLLDAQAVAKSRLYNMKHMQKVPLPKKPRTPRKKKVEVADARAPGLCPMGRVRGFVGAENTTPAPWEEDA